MKIIFILFPILIFFVLITLAFFIKNIFLQNLFFCIASATLGIISTFVVVDNFYKKNEIIENEKILFYLTQNFFNLIRNLFYTLLASYTVDVNLKNKEMFFNAELLINETEKVIEQIKTFKINEYSKYRNNENSNIQLKLLRKNLDEIKESFLYLPKTLNIYKICFPMLINAISTFKYLDFRIKNNKTMLDIDLSITFLIFINDFNKAFIKEIKKLNNDKINEMLFSSI